MKQLRVLCVMVAGLLFSALSVSAQNIYTDRPTQTSAAAIVPVGAFQIETGFFLVEEKMFIPNGSGGIVNTNFQYISINNTLLRYGLTDRIELRISQEVSKMRIRPGNQFQSEEVAFVPTLFGAKFNLLRGQSQLPDISLVASIGGDVFEETFNGTVADVRLAFDKSVSDQFSISSNLGLGLSQDLKTSTGLYTLNFGYSATSKLGVFLEVYGAFPEMGDSSHSMDAGFTYLVNSSLQLDIYGGTGFSSNAADLLFGFGLSKRFLK
ncbi:MAG: transporter [Roseivirga sp.]|uniref:transporter n=1 Tax=Roseivirga sp. TaxID=1964215 RepID=UPI001B13A565|nr:transporter [Roseivirga sp.]MBO6494541.1 transporter [Roseivirga sp.]